MTRKAKPIEPERDDALVLAAARRFAAAGYDATSLNQVLSDAGWQKSSFYHYFADKRRLHDHVVDTLAARLVGGVTAPDLPRLTAEQFWPSMADLLTSLGQSAARHPETRLLGVMFHQEDRFGAGQEGHSGQLQQMRAAVSAWLASAIVRGCDLGVVRRDVPVELLIELTISVLQTLDRWAVRHELHSPGGPSADGMTLHLVRDLIEARLP